MDQKLSLLPYIVNANTSLIIDGVGFKRKCVPMKREEGMKETESREHLSFTGVKI